MSTTSIHPGLGSVGPEGEDFRVIAVPPDLRLDAASRLISEQAGDPLVAAHRFLESAALLKVDLDLMWCTLREQEGGSGGAGSGGGVGGRGVGGDVHVRQVVLAVIGTGHTAMLFVSGPEKRARAWPGASKFKLLGGAALAQAQRERVVLIHRACEEVAAPVAAGAPRAVLAQALLEPRETEAAQALVGAGFLRLGDLAYLRRNLAKAGPGRALEQASHPVWPDGLRVLSIDQLLTDGHSPERVERWLAQALEQSYVDTLDCPELCGLRSTEDVLHSHRSVGVFDPSLWWIVLDHSDIARACLLLSVCPEQDSAELVYLGLSPEVRGKGLGSTLLSFGLRRLYDDALGPLSTPGRVHFGGSGGVTCAVDTRNAPAMKLYKRAAFERFGLRIPFVRSLRSDAERDRA